jgi:crotonobetainyl-CoA hydratase
MDMLLTGRWMEADEALRWGLINRIVPGSELMAAARELAGALAAGPPLVFAAIKEVARESERLSFAEAIGRVVRKDFPTVAALYGSEDQVEGARAFAEKRAPVWKGR